MTEVFRILMPLSKVPDGYQVTKRNGEKVYTVKDKVIIYGLKEYQQEIKGEGVKFLVSEDGKIEAVSDDKQMLAEISEYDLKEISDGIF